MFNCSLDRKAEAKAAAAAAGAAAKYTPLSEKTMGVPAWRGIMNTRSAAEEADARYIFQLIFLLGRGMVKRSMWAL